ncbi:hypothetical protein AWJ09_04640 [Vibrio cholerae]|uniref:hypothetical protein n=1 Tax=Vibrio TaxID=662 RepID=UPI0007C5A5A5|nr:MULTISPECIES: hypothetical protein [Vibrio]KAA1217151.1 hypothetical protein F0Q05_07135 [Vibrio cholerae]KAA1219421.1 hypothetical protein F0P99_08480 [Vibrio cholerae]MCO7065193.1 hypothetical protein [Vibrio paracholerae]MTB75194.1 hypothetical protein [Vibrio cholerae O1 biovar El Tor]OAE83192.1 hypothetical protein AWJ09_04640 [Vibrio cholerae]
MSIDHKEEFKGERYYNKKALAIYSSVIACLLIDTEPDISTMKLLVGTGFTVVWTYLTGTFACLAIFGIANAIFPKSHFEKFIGDYLIWLVPATGLCFFILIAYA